MDIKDFVPLPNLESFKHILAIQPHPDDNEIGAGATLAKLSSMGIKISYLTVSKGKGGAGEPTQPHRCGGLEGRRTELGQ